MANNYYSTLAIIEAELGIDISADAASWGISDTDIYDSGTPTNASFVTQASKKINAYTQTTFSDQTSTPVPIEEVCTALVIRMIERHNRLQQAGGFVSVSDDFVNLSLGNFTYEVELTDYEKELLDQQTSVPFRASTR